MSDKPDVKFSINLPLTLGFHYCEDGSHYATIEWDKLKVQQNMQPYTLKDQNEKKFFIAASDELKLLVEIIEALMQEDLYKVAELIAPMTDRVLKEVYGTTLDDYELKQIKDEEKTFADVDITDLDDKDIN